MPNRQTVAALNRVLIILYRSLAMYLTDATPWTHRGDERAVQVLRHIVADDKAACARIAQYLQDHQAPIDTGDYPMGFTDMHDLSLDYLITRLIRCQHRDIAELEQIVQRLAGDATARQLAEEALGAARAHLESLQELSYQLAQPSAETAAAATPAVVG